MSRDRDMPPCASELEMLARVVLAALHRLEQCQEEFAAVKARRDAAHQAAAGAKERLGKWLLDGDVLIVDGMLFEREAFTNECAVRLVSTPVQLAEEIASKWLPEAEEEQEGAA